MIFVGRLLVQAREIIFVHCDDVIESLEVPAAHPPCVDALQRDSAAFSSRACAPIGRFANVIRMGSGRINNQPFVHASPLGMMTKHALSGRRTADIAHADK